MKSFKRVLILNRAEIAARIARSCEKMGLEPIIVYSDADLETLAVKSAKEAYRLGSAKLSDSYMNTEKILKLAREVKAEAIHPGYGLLSENSDFASQVKNAGLVWIGPSPESMNALSSKSEAKTVAEKTGVPLLPSFYAKDKQDLAVFAREAERIGYPVLIKAAAGGGGRGIRLVNRPEELKSQFELAASEALNSFGSAELLLEKYLPEAHHIEIQIFGDEHGEVVHLGERDCSTQRRHQKLLEESPSPALTAEVRQKMTSDAVRLAKACRYTNAGTVEFLLSPRGDYYFLEVNTRLQVEHPVTEMVTGLDLVEWQLRIARGESLPLKQAQIRFQGHALQARVYAEDPYDNYRPQMGRVEGFHFSETTRVDHFLTERTEITPFYDSMLAKLIAFSPTREQAIEQLIKALDQCLIAGLRTNKSFLKQILLSDFFKNGKTFTRTLDQLQLKEPEATQVEKAAALAALAQYLRATRFGRHNLLGPWSNNLQHRSTVLIKNRSKLQSLFVQAKAHGVIEIQDGQKRWSFSDLQSNYSGPVHHLQTRLENQKIEAIYFEAEDQILLLLEGMEYQFTSPLKSRSGSTADSEGNAISSPLEGSVVRLPAETQKNVKSGDLLVVIEAMKMQFEIRSPRDAEIESVEVKVGTQVKNRQLLIKFKPEVNDVLT